MMRMMKIFRSLVLAAGAAMAASCGGDAPQAAQPREEPAPSQVAAVSLPAVEIGAEIGAFYKDRGFRPLWVRREGLTPAGKQLIEMLVAAKQDGLQPERYNLSLLRTAAAAAGDPAAVAKAELLLSHAFADYVRDLHVPRDEKALYFVDPELAPKRQSQREVLERAASRLRSLRTCRKCSE
jgi:hypothetical protein